MALLRDRDPCINLNRALESPSTQAGSIRKVLLEVESCLQSNRYVCL